jgi:hypothetical protein
MYKVRARYTDSTGNICGPWSDIFNFTNIGRDTNPNAAPTVILDLEKTYIVVDPVIVSKPDNFKAYVYRLYKTTSTADLWDTTPLLEVQSNGQGKFDLLDIPVTSTDHRISEAGISYLVACRMLDNTNNYSPSSSLATIRLTTII